MGRRLVAERLLPKTLLALVALALAGVLLALWSGTADAATTFTVNRTGDGNDLDFPNGTFDGSSDTVCDTSAKSGNQCTLRAAIQEANNTSGANSIDFDIGGKATVKTINVGSTGLGALPVITEAVTIDGYTQRGAKANTLAEGNDAILKIVLNGTNAGTNASGLEISASGSIIRGLVINRFSAFGVIFRGSGAEDNNVEGNRIGTNAKGTERRGNTAGVVISGAPNNTVGGTQPAQRNVISGNTGGSAGGFPGVQISGAGATGNLVMGNFIGTNAKGTGDLGNTGDGVVIQSANNTVGGTVSGARNVISANDNGVLILNSGATGNKVEGNFIGTNAAGTGDLGNDLDGVFIADAPNNTIGGTASGARNTISSNGDDGVLILNGAGLGDATGNEVEGNTISANTGDGVIVASASDNTVGGTTSGAGNAISSNGDDGVEISGSGATGNRVLGNGITANGTNGVLILNSGATGNHVEGNSIFSNTVLGIDLGADGVTANDTKDVDTGPNNLQNFPVITSAIRSNTAGFTTITGTLNSNTFQDYTIQCFVAVPDPSGHGEGQIPVDQDTVTTDFNGNEGFSCVSPIPQPGQLVTATATNTSGTATDTAIGDTSEFSLNQTVVSGP